MRLTLQLGYGPLSLSSDFKTLIYWNFLETLHWPDQDHDPRMTENVTILLVAFSHKVVDWSNCIFRRNKCSVCLKFCTSNRQNCIDIMVWCSRCKVHLMQQKENILMHDVTHSMIRLLHNLTKCLNSSSLEVTMYDILMSNVWNFMLLILFK